MRNSIVEGEPGIFPDPIARVFVAVSRWVRRRAGKEPAPPVAQTEEPSSHHPPPEHPPDQHQPLSQQQPPAPAPTPDGRPPESPRPPDA